ncbi:MAG: prephenate dehydrogenase/arogenate dehydrogenase family protein [Gemmatimonadota bacterium]|nr:prephenate dehydrogenase/arogenate dehydrogenase family protein [Gemmatimonadota bacterium]MDH5197872.1 prephenate dehydrogenase/arogenate dehydrogenase family protein [Gemmatimonadota bacterium]
MRPDALGVVGLGAVGGSIAWQASLAGVRRVLGYSPSPAEGVAALRAGAISDFAPSVRFLVERSEVVVLATPPTTTFDLLPTVARHLRPGALCTDVVPAKGRVVQAAQRAGLADRFAGSHPAVTLTAKTFAAAEPAAFRRALVYVTPASGDEGPAREVADFWATVFDADPVILDAADHDAIVAWTRHLPQVVAALLARACATDGPRGVTYGTEARDVTRPALATVATARDLLLLNREAVVTALDDVETALGGLQRALRDGDTAALDAWLTDAATWRRRLEP